MPDSFDFRSISYFWLISVTTIAAAFAVIGYFIATRKFKSNFVIFLARFGIVFFSLFILEAAVISLLPSFHATMQNIAATLVGGVLSLARASHTISSSTIILQNPYLAFDITAACLGGLLLWTYIALVLAEPTASNRQRVDGILKGLALLLAFNFFRITLSIYIEWRTGFRIHDLFYFFNMLFVLLIWAGWLRTLKSQRTAYPKATS
jgi:exosortase/archaeosortase family protein